MATTEIEKQLAETRTLLQRAKSYSGAVLKQRKGEIKFNTHDIEVLSDLCEIFFGERITNKTDIITLNPICNKKDFTSQINIYRDGKYYTVYSEVPAHKISQQLGK